MYVFLCEHMFSILIPTSRIAGSDDNSIFNILWNRQTAFQSTYTTLHYHQQCVRAIYLHTLKHLLLSVCLIIVILVISHWHFDLHSPNNMILRIFSCAYWLFAYLLWTNVYLNLSPIFKLACHFIIEF